MADKIKQTQIPLPGSWNGNQSLSDIQSRITKTGMSHMYMQDATYGNGWAMVVAYVIETYKYILIARSDRLILTRTSDGTNWSTGTISLGGV